MLIYYILVGKRIKGKYELLFGDYVKSVVEQEKRDTTDAHYEKRSLKVFLVGDKQNEIVAFMKELNK